MHTNIPYLVLIEKLNSHLTMQGIAIWATTLLLGRMGESSLVEMLWKFAGSTHIHWEALQLWQAGRMALMEVQ